MAADIQPYDPGLPDLHPDPGQWSHEDFVAAWQANDGRSAWNRAFLAAAYSGAHGDLQRYADAVGVGYQTMKNYRSVLRAYAKSTDVGTFPFGVADALRGQQDRDVLVQREEPWSVEEARLLVQSRRGPARRTVVRAKAEPVTAYRQEQPPDPSSSSQTETPPAAPEAAPEISSSSQTETPETVPGTAGAVPGTVPSAKPDSAPCPGCRDLQAKLEKAREQIEKLRAAHPDKVMAAELEAVTADRDRLAALLAARPSAPPDSPVQHDPGNGPPEETGAADGEPCAGCGGPGASPAWSLQGSTRGEHHVCDGCLETARRKHPGVVFSRPGPPSPVTTQAELDDIYAGFDFDEATA